MILINRMKEFTWKLDLRMGIIFNLQIKVLGYISWHTIKSNALLPKFLQGDLKPLLFSLHHLWDFITHSYPIFGLDHTRRQRTLPNPIPQTCSCHVISMTCHFHALPCHVISKPWHAIFMPFHCHVFPNHARACHSMSCGFPCLVMQFPILTYITINITFHKIMQGKIQIKMWIAMKQE